MKCPSCGYVSLGDPLACRKCGAAFERDPASQLTYEWEDRPPVDDREAGFREAGWRVEEETWAVTGTEAPPGAPASTPTGRAGSGDDLSGLLENLSPVMSVEEPPASTVVVRAPAAFEPGVGPPPPVRPAPSAEGSPGQHVETTIAADRSNAFITPAVEPAAGLPADAFTLDDLRIELEEPPADEPPPRREEPTQLVFLQEEPPPVESLEDIPEDYHGDVAATFGRRIAAFLADASLMTGLLLLYVVGAGIALARQGVRPLWLLTNPWPVDALLPFLLLGLLVTGVYSVGGIWRNGRTPGKRLLGLRVIHETGRPLTFGESVARWLGSLLAGLPLLIGYLWALVDREGRGWHDRLAGTRVTQARPPRPA